MRVLRVPIRTHPGASQEKVEIAPDGQVHVWVRQRAVDGKANAAIPGAVAAALNLRPRQVVLMSGLASRDKLLMVDLSSEAELRARLETPP